MEYDSDCATLINFSMVLLLVHKQERCVVQYFTASCGSKIDYFDDFWWLLVIG